MSYVVVLGHRPGIYDTWDECDLAIGDRHPPPPVPTPHWRLKDTEEEAETYFTEMTAAFRSAFEASHRFEREMNEMRRNFSKEQKQSRKRALQVDQRHQRLRSELQEVKTKVARLQKIIDRTSPVEAQLETILDPVRATIRQLKSSQAENPFKLQIEVSGHCSVRTQVRTGPGATFGVYFGDNSPLNGTFDWFNGVNRTKSAGEILAALVILRIAQDAGIEQVRIKSKCSFLKISSGDSRRANDDLLTMLDSKIGVIFDWVPVNDGIRMIRPRKIETNGTTILDFFNNTL